MVVMRHTLYVCAYFLPEHVKVDGNLHGCRNLLRLLEFIVDNGKNCFEI